MPNPYIVYGTVQKNGVVQNGITVTIENITKSTSDNTTTDSDGHYIYDDLVALPTGYDIGDTIRISITDNVLENFIAASLPEEKQIDFIYNNYTIDCCLSKIVTFKPIKVMSYCDGIKVMSYCDGIKVMSYCDGIKVMSYED